MADDRVRGKAFKTLLLDAIREGCMLEADHNSTKEDLERLYISHVAERAFDISDNNSTTLLKELLNKSYPGLKAALPEINFDLPEAATPLQKAEAILLAVSKGEIPPDVGVMLIQASKHVIDIEATTELKDRLTAIEKELGLID